MGWPLINSHHYWHGYGRLVEPNTIKFYAIDNFLIWTHYNHILPQTIGVYRILCESCLSHGTPHAFKKAGYACLAALISYHLSNESNNDDNDPTVEQIFNDVHLSIIESILYPLESMKLWKHPIQTLFDAFTYDPIKDLILKQPEYISALLRLSLREGSVKSEILNQFKFAR